ncbi:uncharacterized protein LOC111703410 isoform X2 [Eurytemora carolleeae]|uniref:uncharacterized protein LOC111703410 isoform X2 n=1 Tax=Eurytemora carolleeae TaxID=1294199 RepID=UPI000C77AE12|nr:uncharacterized protein LOC111703410 isoform X2 [Eurytemora carolleeae]|eukprot:XP_023331119.1 uncharacterized protein LOC111703410 isoform X2 [Eurytemora affinis]
MCSMCSHYKNIRFRFSTNTVWFRQLKQRLKMKNPWLFFHYCTSGVLPSFSLLILSLCTFSPSWEGGLLHNSTHTGYILYEDGKSPMFLNPHILAPVRSGLLSTCLDISDEIYQKLRDEMPTLSEKCIDHSNVYPNQTGIPPRWLRVLVKSISCSLTSLIIIAAAIILGIVGVVYQQSACLLVDSVLYFLAAGSASTGLILYWFGTQERQDVLFRGLEPFTGWCPAVSWIGVLISFLSSAELAYLTRLMNKQKQIENTRLSVRRKVHIKLWRSNR